MQNSARINRQIDVRSGIDAGQRAQRPVAVDKVVPDSEAKLFPEEVAGFIPGEDDQRRFGDPLLFEGVQRGLH